MSFQDQHLNFKNSVTLKNEWRLYNQAGDISILQLYKRMKLMMLTPVVFHEALMSTTWAVKEETAALEDIQIVM